MGYVASGRPVGRPRQFYKYELPSGVVKVVRAQCADYARKELCIKEGSVSGETLGAYIAVNAAYIATAMKAIAKAITDKNNLAIMHSKADPTKAIIIKGEGEGIDITQLVLPVRMPNR